ncbi:MAG: hypothetical protein KGI03_00770, partial [Patescibacteria group bacterium]|nr:hypothetical protein [Patescibacteria group bacterium]
MELIIHRVHPKNGEGEELAHTLFECEVKWHQLSDFLHFEVFPLYLKEVSGALGAWRFLYHPVLYVERATTDYWILPIAGWI